MMCLFIFYVKCFSKKHSYRGFINEMEKRKSSYLSLECPLIIRKACILILYSSFKWLSIISPMENYLCSFPNNYRLYF